MNKIGKKIEKKLEKILMKIINNKKKIIKTADCKKSDKNIKNISLI